MSRASGRAELAAAAAHELDFTVPLDRLAYTFPDGRHGLEAGLVTVLLGLSSADIRDELTIEVPPWLFFSWCDARSEHGNPTA